MKKVKLVCLVEDDPIQIFLMTKNIELTGMVDQTIIFQNGKAAYDGLKSMLDAGQPLPDLLFLDINMPIWDGWVFLEEFNLLQNSKPIEIYILTSSTSAEDFEKARLNGLANRYLMKPLTRDRLVDILEQVGD